MGGKIFCSASCVDDGTASMKTCNFNPSLTHWTILNKKTRRDLDVTANQHRAKAVRNIDGNKNNGNILFVGLCQEFAVGMIMTRDGSIEKENKK